MTLRKICLHMALVISFAYLSSAPILADVLESALPAYRNGDFEKAISAIKPVAEEGDPRAQYILGGMYTKGEGVQMDDGEAQKWYRKAAEQGMAAAQANLGTIYENGIGAKQDYAESKKWYSKAAEQGFIVAQSGLSRLYANGLGVAKSDEDALFWMGLAANSGQETYATSRDNIAQRLTPEQVVSVDGRIKKWRPSAGVTHPRTLFEYGTLYEKGEGGFVKDIPESLNCYRKAAGKGVVPAMVNLGMLYDLGKDVPQDFGEAAKWYRSAAEKGNAQAQNNLGGLLSQGAGVKQDNAEAVEWFRKAAEQGHAISQGALGEAYAEGIGVSQSNEEAYFWLTLSVRAGHQLASELQKKIAGQLTQEQHSKVGIRVEEWMPNQ